MEQNNIENKEEPIRVTTTVAVDVNTMGGEEQSTLPPIDFKNDRYPYCIVWTPIPVLTWLIPIIGHMGICTSTGVIRDFAGSYFVSEDNMGFGKPTRYIRMHPKNVDGGRDAWDEAVAKASVIYGTRMHNLFLDNCHSHVATALCGMRYNRRTNWNMIRLAFSMFFFGRYVGFFGFIKTWLPFVIAISLCVFFALFL